VPELSIVPQFSIPVGINNATVNLFMIVPELSILPPSSFSIIPVFWIVLELLIVSWL
jgi:hypothetical protein